MFKMLRAGDSTFCSRCRHIVPGIALHAIFVYIAALSRLISLLKGFQHFFQLVLTDGIAFAPLLTGSWT